MPVPTLQHQHCARTAPEQTRCNHCKILTTTALILALSALLPCAQAALPSDPQLASAPEPVLVGPIGAHPDVATPKSSLAQQQRLQQSIEHNRAIQSEIVDVARRRGSETAPPVEVPAARKLKLEHMRRMVESTPSPEQWHAVAQANWRNSNAASAAVTDTRAKSTTRWTAIGTQIANADGSTRAMGAVSDIEFAYDPFDQRTTLFAGTIAGGLWKQRLLAFIPVNLPISESLPGSPSVGAFHVGETGSPFLLLGTGANGRSAGSGLYRSTDNGVSWALTPMQGLSPGAFFKIDRSVRTASSIYACTSAGFYSSLDSGLTWVQRRSTPCSDFYEFGGELGGIVMVADYSGSAPYLHYSIVPTSGAWTWSAADTSGISGSIGRLSIAISHPNSDYVYAFAADASNNANGVFRSDTYGLSGWVRVSTPAQSYGNFMGFYANEIRVAPNNPDVVVAGMVNMYISTNATSPNPTWEQIVTSLYDHTDVEFVPQSIIPGNTRLVVSSDGGIYTYDWVSREVGRAESNRGMNVQLIMGNDSSMSQSRANRNLIGAGMWDTGSSLVDLSASASTRITYLAGADGGALGLSTDNSSHMIGSFGAPWTRWSSTDRGATWRQLDAGCAAAVEAPMTYPWAYTLEYTPGFSQRTYTFSRTGGAPTPVYRLMRQALTSVGCSWTPLHAGNLPALFASTTLGDVFVAVANNAIADVVYLGAHKSDKVYVLTGSAPNMTITERTPSFTPLATETNGNVSFLSADRNPGRPQTIYQTFRAATQAGRIYLALSDNAGQTWEDVSGNINAVATGSTPHELIGNSADLNQLFVATSVGVYRSDNRGVTWTAYGEGLPASLNVVNLEFDGTVTPPRLLLGSYGRGFYSRDVSPRVTSPQIFRNGFE
jgi:hypothetical protein